MNSFEFNKIFGACTGALLIYLLAGFVSDKLYHVSEPEQLAYALEIAETETVEEAAPEVDLATLLASADVDSGASVFRKCSACHKIEDGANGVGPHLYGVVGRDVGSVAGFNYSGALNAAAEVWGFEELYAFLENPKAYAPGTSMGFAGIRSPEERADVIAYLNVEGGSNLPLPEPAAPEAAPEAAEEPAAAEAPAEEDAVETAAADPAPEAAEAPDASETEEPAVAAVEEAVEAEPVVDVAALVADGQATFGAVCSTCHEVEDGRNGIGPHLYGVIGRDVAGVPFFRYSEKLAGLDGAWTAERLDAYLANREGLVEAHELGFGGLSNDAQRAAVVAYLTTLGGEAATEAPATEAAPADEAAAEPAEPAAPAAEVVEEQEAAVEAPAEEAVAEAAPVEEQAAAEPAPVEEQAAAEPAPVEEEVAAAAPAEEPAPVEETAQAEAPAAAGGVDPAFAALYQAASLDDGKKAFRKCAACHQLQEGRNAVGPSLYGVVGRAIGGVDGFSYSAALSGKGGEWTFAELNAWLDNPKAYAPGNRMAFAGIRNAEERAALIKYLNEEGGSNVPLE